MGSHLLVTSECCSCQNDSPCGKDLFLRWSYISYHLYSCSRCSFIAARTMQLGVNVHSHTNFSCTPRCPQLHSTDIRRRGDLHRLWNTHHMDRIVWNHDILWRLSVVHPFQSEASARTATTLISSADCKWRRFRLTKPNRHVGHIIDCTLN